MALSMCCTGISLSGNLKIVNTNHNALKHIPVPRAYDPSGLRQESVRKALFAALEGEEDYIEAPNLLSKINLYFT